MSRALIHDISNWQGDLSRYWQLFREKCCKAIIIKATEGLAYYSYWKDTAPIVKEQGFLLGSYHYYRQHIQNQEGTWVSCSPTRQAENHFNWLEKCGIKPDLPPALDVEPGNNPQGVGSAGVESCLNRMEQLFGRTPILYSNPSTLTGIAKPHWIKFPLWLAHYTSEEKVSVPKPWVGWTIWQFSDKVTYTPAGSTVKKPIDHNWFNGSEVDLIQFAKGGAAGTDEVHPEPAEGPPPAACPEPAEGAVGEGGGQTPAADPPDNSQLTIINLNIEVLKERIKNLENWAGGFKP